MAAHYIVAIESYDGEGSSLLCLNGSGVEVPKMFCVVAIDSHGAAIVDYGYRSAQEASEAWPDAKMHVDDRIVDVRRPLKLLTA